MKLKDIINEQYPDGAISVEELFERFVKKPSKDSKDEHRLSSTDFMRYLGWDADIPQAKRASAWLKRHGYRNYGDDWCWKVAFQSDVTPFPQLVV